MPAGEDRLGDAGRRTRGPVELAVGGIVACDRALLQEEVGGVPILAGRGELALQRLAELGCPGVGRARALEAEVDDDRLGMHPLGPLLIGLGQTERVVAVRQESLRFAHLSSYR